jgi:hypothetical protein
MKKIVTLFFVLGVTITSYAVADMCPTVHYKLYSPVAGDGSTAGDVWVPNRPADEA